ncbi:MAG: DivIVA domain-containing protein [Acutalibacteraceae bacterium]
MMTPSELREYEFKGAGRNAYKSDDVDNFFGEVAVAYEKIYRENAELVKRISLLADRLEEFKQNESEIKQAVLGAQKAADIIVKEAESAVEDSKAEAEAILAAAKGEADIIKSDAEKQAVADSDLLLSVARDKAEEIINKAKEEAHGILIAANDSASDTVGAATRTITSESIHYEMLKKEVSDFRASILAQYKAHIELISKLPELAIEEAAEKEAEETETVEEEPGAVETEDNVEFIEPAALAFDNDGFEEEITENEEVVKTTLPYDFFEENTTLEFVSDDENGAEDEEETAETVVDNLNFELFDDEGDSKTENEEEKEEESRNEPEDIPISKGFSVDAINVTEALDIFSNSDKSENTSLFDSFETVDSDVDEEGEEPKKKRGFFKRKK